MIVRALEQDGLPPSKHNTVYSVLRRREAQVGDIIRMGDEWALTEWYPNNPNLTKREPKNTKETKKRKSALASATKAAVSTVEHKAASSGPTLTDLAEQILKESGKPMSAVAMVPKMTELGRTPLKQNLAHALRNDPKKRFKESNGEFDLAG